MCIEIKYIEHLIQIKEKMIPCIKIVSIKGLYDYEYLRPDAVNYMCIKKRVANTRYSIIDETILISDVFEFQYLHAASWDSEFTHKAKELDLRHPMTVDGFQAFIAYLKNRSYEKKPTIKTITI